MEEHQNVRPSTGTIEWNRSYYTGKSLSALHSSQQFHDDTVSTSVHPRASTQRFNDTTPSCSALGSQLPHGHIGSPVLAGPTRNVTREAIPTSLAVTQLSFLEFLQRCNLHQSPFHSWTPLCRRLHLVMPLRMSPRRRLISLSPRYLSTRLCRRLYTVFISHTFLSFSTCDREWNTPPCSSTDLPVS